MMKKVRVILGILCLTTLLGLGVYLYMGYKNQDTEPPVLQAGSDILNVSIADDESKLLMDVTAKDNRDGDISDRIIIEKIEKKEGGKVNEFLVTYVAFDQASNVGYLTRDLIYEDYRLPHFSLEVPLRFPENQSFTLLNCFKADDCLEGDISTYITLDDESGILKESPRAGFYEVTVSVANSLGDVAELPVQVEIYANNYEEQMNRPKIILTEYLTYIKSGSTFDAKSYLDYIEGQGRFYIDYTGKELEEEVQKISAEDIQIKSNVETDTPGVYSVLYAYTSGKTGATGNARLIVVVE